MGQRAETTHTELSLQNKNTKLKHTDPSLQKIQTICTNICNMHKYMSRGTILLSTVSYTKYKDHYRWTTTLSQRLIKTLPTVALKIISKHIGGKLTTVGGGAPSGSPHFPTDRGRGP